MKLTRVGHFLNENQIILVLVALVAGVMWPSWFRPLAPYSTPILMTIFFASSLRLNIGEMVGYAKDARMMAISNVVKLFFIPLAMWLPLHFFAPEWALSFLIVGAVPTGLTIALIADLFGGKTSLAMLVSVTTSLLAPITVPLVILAAVGRSIPFPVATLFGSLFLTIVIPFVLALLVKRLAQTTVEKHDLLWRETSLILFALLVAAVTADSVGGEAIALGWSEVGLVMVMLVFMGGIAWLSYAITGWRKVSERITVALCMLYMNNTLALYIGNTFFKEQHIVPKLLIILAAVNLLLPPVKWFAHKNMVQAKKLYGRKETVGIRHT